MTLHQINPATPTFDDFWELVFKKADRSMAEAKWNKITGDGLETRMQDRDSGLYEEVTHKATPERIIAGYREYRRQVCEWDNKYIMAPATWLNRGRWTDFEE